MSWDSLELAVSPHVSEKISARGISILEVEEAFFNWRGVPLVDTRNKNRTIPETVWFISHTAEGRLLKVVGIPLKEDSTFRLKTAYEPDDDEVVLYENNQ